MDISVEGVGSELAHEDWEAGQLYTAWHAGIPLLCFNFEHKEAARDRRFILVLSGLPGLTIFDDIDDRISGPRLLVQGAFIARATGDPSAHGEWVVASSTRALGALAIGDDRAPCVTVDHPQSRTGFSFINLRTGQAQLQAGALYCHHWELVHKWALDKEVVLARFPLPAT